MRKKLVIAVVCSSCSGLKVTSTWPTQTVILFREKAFWTHYSSHCGCALIWNKAGRRGLGGGKGIAPKLNCKRSFYAGWKQNFNWRELLGSCVLCMGCTEERHTVMLQSHLCHTLHNYSLFSKNALFIIGESDNNCTGVALKLGALSRVGTMHQTCDNEEGHNLHKPANHHLTGIVGNVYNHE